MNEFDDGGLNSTVQQLRAEVEKLKSKLSEASKRLIESEDQYVALQEANNEKWTANNSLQAEVRSLENTKIRLTEESNYWKESYKEVKARADIQEDAYLKVIKALSN